MEVTPLSLEQSISDEQYTHLLYLNCSFTQLHSKLHYSGK